MQNSPNISALTAEEIRQKKFLKRGLQLSILVIGESGTGKSTFINTLCDENIITAKLFPSELMIEAHHAKIHEGGTQISLDVTVAPGFGDFINNSESTKKVVDFIEAQFESLLNEECRIQRNPKFQDSRIHVALYFIRPTGKGLRNLDIQCLKELGERCNVIPIISKADLLTEEEKILNRSLIMRDINANGIKIYDFSTCFDDLEENGNGDNEGIMSLVPFAIISGTERKIIDEVEHKVRKLPHGIVKVDDPEVSDFLILRTCLLGACLQDLKETTHSVYYESYRTEMLSKANILNSMDQRSNNPANLLGRLKNVTPGTRIPTEKSDI